MQVYCPILGTPFRAYHQTSTGTEARCMFCGRVHPLVEPLAPPSRGSGPAPQPKSSEMVQLEFFPVEGGEE